MSVLGRALKNLTKCLWRWEPDRRFNFFLSPPAHLCAVTYITQISLHVTFNNNILSLELEASNDVRYVYLYASTVTGVAIFDVFKNPSPACGFAIIGCRLSREG